MGATLVAAALVHVCPALGRNHASRVALLLMANTAKDNDPEPWYGAGWQPIAAALGLAGSETTQRDRVTKVLAELENLRVIRIIEAKAPGRHVRYGLQLGRLRLVHNSPDSPQLPVDNHRAATR